MDGFYFLLHFAAPAVKFLKQLVWQSSSALTVIAEHAAADGEQDVTKIHVNDVGFFPNGEIDRPIFSLDSGVGHQVQQFGGFSAAAMPGEEEFRRAVKRRHERVN